MWILLYSVPYIEILYPCRTMGDRLGVAKASGNLGNTLKVMGKFKEAICCCERHLSISQELQDKVLSIGFCVGYVRGSRCESESVNFYSALQKKSNETNLGTGGSCGSPTTLRYLNS